MMGTSGSTDARLAGEVLAVGLDQWPPAVLAEFEANATNTRVGSILLSDDGRVRVWSIRLGVGERLPAHRHELDYFWTALRDGVGLQHTDDGITRRVHYRTGDTRHTTLGPGDYLLHDLQNDGDTVLEFITVEHHRHGEPDPIPAARPTCGR
jgi:beta-alanine degradation protein BauB